MGEKYYNACRYCLDNVPVEETYREPLPPNYNNLLQRVEQAENTVKHIHSHYHTTTDKKNKKFNTYTND
jgi:hypothetical protein